jgi:hypothetical protein
MRFVSPKLLILCLFAGVTLSLFAPEAAEARRRKKSSSSCDLVPQVKRDYKSSVAACLVKVSSPAQAREILRRNGVRISPDANRTQLRSTALAVQQLERLAGGRSEFVEGVTVTFPKSRRYSRYLKDSKVIQMGANFTDSNAAHVTHELGHHAGRAGLYEPYFDQVPRCRISCYGRTNRAEEFAEVYAAFVNNPELLRNSKDPGCRRAYDFLVEAFPKAHMYAYCDAKNESFDPIIKK